MKKFEIPTLEVDKLEIMDVITVSGETECTDAPVDCPNDLGI